MNELHENILRTLLYYDIFQHPLNAREIYYLLPQNTISNSDLEEFVKHLSQTESQISAKDNFYFVGNNDHYVMLRKCKERFSRKSWIAARIVTNVIKRFPFVRAVFVTGSLSKNSSLKGSDLDFMIVTKDSRLWICRTILMLFKKIFLFNSYKFFCINYFVTESSLEIEEKNIYTATEIVHIKATFNSDMMRKFINSNLWIKKYFPNYKPTNNFLNSSGYKVNNRKSVFQKLSELFFSENFGDRLDKYFMEKSVKHWSKKYSYINEKEHRLMFKSTRNVSKAHPGNMQKVIIHNYKERLRKFNLNYNYNE